MSSTEDAGIYKTARNTPTLKNHTPKQGIIINKVMQKSSC